jgi:acetyl-CoA C-acetyltransferase
MSRRYSQRHPRPGLDGPRNFPAMFPERECRSARWGRIVLPVMNNPVIASIARTPIGRYGGGLAPLRAVELGGRAIAAAVERSGVNPSDIDEVIFGQVLQAGEGQITARQAAVAGGLPMTVPSITINKVCLSGMAAIGLASRAIRLGDAAFVMAGGMESMSNAPHVVRELRWGARMGDATLVDVMNHDGLFCAFDHCTMGESSDAKNAQLGISRREQDEWSARSHERALAATESGAFADEITAVSVPQRKGEPVVVSVDEGMRPGTTVESLGALRPAFVSDGTITAGNASQISDGAAAAVVADRAAAEAAGMPVLAEIVSYGQIGGVDPTLHERPAEAIRVALKNAGLEAADLDLVEINEAFAAVSLWSARMLGIGEEKVNVNGGGVALGHPIGASGARVVVTLVNALRRRGGGIGAAALCGGGGQGDALIVKVEG